MKKLLLLVAIFALSTTFALADSGYTTSVDIYLDVDAFQTNDLRFDWSSAVNTAADVNGECAHRRDFIFNCGFYNDDNAGNRFICAASNNAPGWPKGGTSPYTITQTGWYTFEHVFYDDGLGILAVDFNIYNSTGDLLTSWTRSDGTDAIGVTVGGNRYGWLIDQDIYGDANPAIFDEAPLYIDNSKLCTDGGCSFSQGFESNVDDWFAYPAISQSSDVAASGSYSAETTGAYTQWGAYSCEFPEGNDEPDPNEVPEFGLLAGLFAVGLAGLFIYKKRSN